jgi:hypothetical protein
MTRRLTQTEAARLFKAAKAEGYDRASIIQHPDGRIEVIAEVPRDNDGQGAPNEWDDVLHPDDRKGFRK